MLEPDSLTIEQALVSAGNSVRASKENKQVLQTNQQDDAFISSVHA